MASIPSLLSMGNSAATPNSSPLFGASAAWGAAPSTSSSSSPTTPGFNLPTNNTVATRPVQQSMPAMQGMPGQNMFGPTSPMLTQALTSAMMAMALS
jgi:hypothetical protein